MRTAFRRPAGSVWPALLLWGGLTAGCQEPDAGSLELAVTSLSSHPRSAVHFRAGPAHRPVLTHADLTATSNASGHAGPATVPAEGRLPFLAAVVLLNGDTAATLVADIVLYPGYRHLVSVLVAPNLAGVFWCSSPLGQVPLVTGAAPADTLYLWYSGIPPGKVPPVC